MSKKMWFMVLAIPTLYSQMTYAQTSEIRSLGLKEIYELADRNSKSLKALKSANQAALSGVKAAQALRLPEVNLSLSASYLGDGYLCDRDFSNGMNVDMPHFGNNFSLLASQAIYTGGALSSGIELAKLGERMSALDLEKNRQDIRFMLTGYYLDLFKLKNQLTVFDKNIELTKQLITQMEARRKQGTVLRNDITRYELQLENLKLQRQHVADALSIVNYQLVTTIGLPSSTSVSPAEELKLDDAINQVESNWQEMASTKNLNLKQATLAIDINKQQVRLEKSAKLPHIGLVAEEHWDGPITVEVPVINKNFNYWFVGVGVQYSLSSLFKSPSKIRQAQIKARKAQEDLSTAQQSIEQGVQASLTNYITTFSDLRTREKSVELATQNYQTIDNRYKNELALLTDMIDASNMKLSAELDLVNARINVLYAYYKMKYMAHSL